MNVFLLSSVHLFIALNRRSSGRNSLLPALSFDEPEVFDATGTFHWCPDKTFEECILTNSQNEAFAKDMSGHVAVCIFAEERSPVIGLQNLVMPLRASSFKYEELKPLVILGDKAYMEKEWTSLMNFPGIYVLPVSNS